MANCVRLDLDLKSDDGVSSAGAELKAEEGSTICLNINGGIEGAGSKLVVVWSLNGDIIPHLENYYEYGKSSTGGIFMRIPFARIEDSGIWIGEIYNLNGTSTATPRILSCLVTVVQKSVKTIMGRVEMVGVVGSDIILDVGQDCSSVQWKLPNSRSQSGSRRFAISSLTYRDSGKYVATFESDSRTVQKFFFLDVEGPPDAVIGLNIREEMGKIEISWKGTSYDGGSCIEYYIVSYVCNGNQLHQTNSLSFIIDKNTIDTSSLCVFKVAAANKYGIGEWSEMEYSDHVVLRTEGFQDFTKMEELGKGRFGMVFRVEKDGREYAGKYIKCIRSMDKEKAKLEIEILSIVRGHENLVQIIAAYQLSREIVILTELLGGGELFERIVADDFNLTENKCQEFIRDILLGIQYVHEKSIIHLDIKPENILITPRGLKIIDFGLSQKHDPEVKQCVLFGTPEFVSPEIINYEPIGFYCDIWSIGVLTYVLMSGLSPFMGNNDSETFANVTRGDFDFDDDAFDEVSQECLGFIRGCLAMSAGNRLTSTQCLNHNWMQQNSNAEIKKDKLKGFVLRRKWQKTGNAIRAIGRLKSRCSTSSGHEDS